MRTPLTPAHAKALTVLLLSIRPDWSKDYTLDAVSQMRHIEDDLERVIRVAVRGALTPNIRKPDVLAMTGDHWKARADERGAPEGNHVRKCKQCGGFHTPDSPHDPIALERTPDHRPHILEARKLLAGKKPATHAKETTP